jgi:hypothetical protein
MTIKGVPLSEWSGSASTDALHQTIKEFNSTTSKQSQTMVYLSWAMAVLAFASLVASGVQIWLTLRYSPVP